MVTKFVNTKITKQEKRCSEIINNKNRTSIKHGFLSIENDNYSCSTSLLGETLMGTPS